MDFVESRQTLTALLKKHRWAAAVLAVGLLLMLLPDAGGQQKAAPSAQVQESPAEPDLQQQLEALLSRLEGAGKVQLVLSIASGPQNHYQTDDVSSGAGESYDRNSRTVLVTGADRSQTGLLKRTDPPRYLGAVVLCQGADRPSVKLAVVDAVAAATGLSSDKIAVWKMK